MKTIPPARPITDRIILGIDPGTTIMGYGIIRITGSKVTLVDMGHLRLPGSHAHERKLKTVFEKVMDLICRHHPDELAIEAPFYGKNVQAMLKLGRAQGVAIAAALSRSLPVFEYSPKKVKQSIAGNGNASKEQVAAMLQSLFGLKTLPKNLDTTDGLAIALCHHFQNSNLAVRKTKGYSGWKGFLAQNPDRAR